MKFRGANAMMASSRSNLRRIILRFVIAAGLVCFLQIAAPRPSIAKTRAPIEMGDPDGTGDQKPGTGPNATVAPGKVAGVQGAALSVNSGLTASSRAVLISYLYLLWRQIIRT
jgi:hypothetical protein